jgi:hypothetical protein
MRTQFTNATSLLATALITAALSGSAFAQTTKQPTTGAGVSTTTGAAVPDANMATPQTGATAGSSTNATGAVDMGGTTGTAATGANGALGTGANPSTNAATTPATPGMNSTGSSTTGTSAAGAGMVTGTTDPAAMDHSQSAPNAMAPADGTTKATGKSKKAKKDKTN